ncbi:MAG: hypothetical protein K6T51_02875 [Rubrobacteraceae bacterium]|nr:hypothetical protein [Rubrobacteraceae bacterium]
MARKILVSGFEPYGDLGHNPTRDLAEQAPGLGLEGVEVSSIVLPVEYDRCAEILIGEVDRLRPDAVIACGLAPGRTAITPERVGLNVKDTAPGRSLPDNRGRAPRDEPVTPDGPDALFSTLPCRSISEALLSRGIPSYVSNTAGTYICNNTLYALLDHVRSEDLPTLAGFIHFPASTELALENPLLPSLPFEMMQEALGVAIEVVLRAGVPRP